MRLAWFLLMVCVAASAAEYRAFWADAFNNGFKTPAQVDKMIDDVVAAKANAIFLQARRRGDVYFLKSVEPVAQDAALQPGFDALEYTIAKAHERGIEVHGWFVVTPLWDNSGVPPRAPNHVFNLHGPRAEGRDMWMTMTARGTISRSVDPGHPDVIRHLAGVITEPLRHYELDGIHLDYIRYPEDDNYGWNPTAVDRFNRIAARWGAPANDTAFADFRRRQVTDLVRQVYLRAFELKPQAKVTAALITWGNGPLNDAEFRGKDAYSRVYQNWPAWLAEGILDIGMPMMYFDNARFSAFLTSWLNYAKDRQAGRATMPGLGIYLNEIPATVEQVRRTLAPSPAGNSPMGVALYSYANTNTIVNNAPRIRNEEFYRTLAELFGEPSPVPELPWKKAPAGGHLLGSLTVDGGPPWLNDNVDVTIHSADREWRTATDSTGFFGAVDLPPGEYHVRLARAGEQLFRTAPQALAAGGSLRFDIFLKAADFSAVAPRILSASKTEAAPGEVVSVDVARLHAQERTASAVPLPMALNGVQVLVNGSPAALTAVRPGAVEFQLPLREAERWNVQIRYAGTETEAFAISAVTANPAILSARRTEWGYEVLATGLGATTPAPAPGAGGSPTAPYNTVAATVSAVVNGEEARVFWAGLQPYQPWIYQINVGAGPGELRLSVGGRTSAPFRLE